MKQCDVCLKETSDLIDLLETHQTREIKHCCSECERILNDHKSKLQTVTSKILLDWFKLFMTNKRKENLK